MAVKILGENSGGFILQVGLLRAFAAVWKRSLILRRIFGECLLILKRFEMLD